MIIGSYVLNPVKLRIGKALILGAQAVDAALHPKYRGQGLYEKLVAGALDAARKLGVVATYAFPNYASYKGQIRLGYQPVSDLPIIHKILNPSSALENYGLRDDKVKKIAKYLINPPRKMAREPIVSQIETKKIRSFDDEMDDFWRICCEKNRSVMVERDRDYLNWRYFGNPDKEYSVYLCKGKTGKILGYSVLSVERQTSTGNIVDILTLPNMPKIANHLVECCLNHFENEGLDLATCWMFKGHAYYDELKKQGFSEYIGLLSRLVSRPKYIYKLILYVNNSAALTDAMHAGTPGVGSFQPDWFITQGDADYG